jgi:DNA-binding LytR/AlgR family response regulator
MTYRRDSLNDRVAVHHAAHRDIPLADATRRRLPGDTVLAAFAESAAAADSSHTRPPTTRPATTRPAATPPTATPPTATPPANLSATPDVILVKAGFRQVAVRVREIICIESSRNYVRIHLETGAILRSRVPIGRIAQHLGTDRFLRVHRGCLVSIERVRGITSMTGGRLLLTLGDTTKVVVARDRRRSVLAEIGVRPTSRA